MPRWAGRDYVRSRMQDSLESTEMGPKIRAPKLGLDAPTRDRSAQDRNRIRGPPSLQRSEHRGCAEQSGSIQDNLRRALPARSADVATSL